MTEEKKSFEESLDLLQSCVDSLEEGNLPLKETLEKFDKGLKLVHSCNAELDVAEQRIEKIIEKDGEPESEPFEQEK